MPNIIEKKLLTTKELKGFFGVTDSMQWHRLCAELQMFGAFRLPGSGYRMAEDDLERYLNFKKLEIIKK